MLIYFTDSLLELLSHHWSGCSRLRGIKSSQHQVRKSSSEAKGNEQADTHDEDQRRAQFLLFPGELCILCLHVRHCLSLLTCGAYHASACFVVTLGTLILSWILLVLGLGRVYFLWLFGPFFLGTKPFGLKSFFLQRHLDWVARDSFQRGINTVDVDGFTVDL